MIRLSEGFRRKYAFGFAYTADSANDGLPQTSLLLSSCTTI